MRTRYMADRDGVVHVRRNAPEVPYVWAECVWWAPFDGSNMEMFLSSDLAATSDACVTCVCCLTLLMRTGGVSRE